MADRVLILGASARAAAASARRAGLDPVALDLFADRDTRQLCECLRCPAAEYPAGLFRLARTLPDVPWLYTGGLENYPDLVGELAADRELWGNGPAVLRQVRDPLRLQDWCDEHDFRFPPTLPAGLPAPPGRWLRKPFASAGGAGVRWADGGRLPATHYSQQFVPGVPASAVIWSTPTGETELVGGSRQLVGTAWAHADAFRYAGNVSAGEAEADPDGELTGLADRLAEAFGLWGLWGLDLILPAGGLPVLVEVNPRYPASAELVEFVTGTPALRPPAGPSCFEPAHIGPAPPATRPAVVGKAIYYAPARLTFPAAGPWDESVRHAADVWRRPDYADVPHPGDVIEPGHPVLTILAAADTGDECVRRLQSRAADLDRLFGFPTPAEGQP